MPDLFPGSIGIILTFFQVREHFVNALDKPAESFFRNILGNQFFHGT